MALSSAARRRLEVAMARRAEAKEIADAIDAGGNAQAAVVAAITPSDLATITGTYGNPAEPTGAEVDASVNALGASAETRLDALDSKVNAILTSLKNAGLMASA